LTGTSDLFDVGTRQLEGHHEMVLEQVDGTKNIFRARVIDQLEIDRLFHAGEINKHQYAMAERLFDLAVKAGCYVRGINISELIAHSSTGPLPRPSLRVTDTPLDSTIDAGSACHPRLVSVPYHFPFS
jgi:hypothetical protein